MPEHGFKASVPMRREHGIPRAAFMMASLLIFGRRCGF
jgi:hypothetical protein